MEYIISKIRQKNGRNEYDVVYPVTTLSAVILDDEGLKKLTKAIVKELQSGDK